MTILTDYETRSSRKRSAVVWTGLIIIGTWWLLSPQVLKDEPRVGPPQPQRIKPLSERLGCGPWQPGQSRTATATFTEGEHGNLVGTIDCHRYRMQKQKVVL